MQLPSLPREIRYQRREQPRSQGLSSSRPLGEVAPGGGKKRDPGNEVEAGAFMGVSSAVPAGTATILFKQILTKRV